MKAVSLFQRKSSRNESTRPIFVTLVIFVNLAETNLVNLVVAETAVIKESRKEHISQLQF